MRFVLALCLGILTTVSVSVPVEKRSKLDTIISGYADIDASEKRALNTVISAYADVDTSPDKRTLKTVISEYADVDASTDKRRLPERGNINYAGLEIESEAKRGVPASIDAALASTKTPEVETPTPTSSSAKPTKTLETVINRYNDVEKPSPVAEAPPTRTLETVIHYYADVE